MNATLGREAVASVPPTDAGAGSGINNTSRYVGAAVGVTVVTVVALGAGGGPAALVAGWNIAVLLGIGLSVVGAVVVLLLEKVRRRSGDRPPTPRASTGSSVSGRAQQSSG